ncbi:MAG: hypothetical protein P3C10_14495, partial [Gemmatimonadota bacterium]|nr:hypothetical protein [Gemmatimonadota bacterium]
MRPPRWFRSFVTVTVAAAAGVLVRPLAAQSVTAPPVAWPTASGDPGAMRYSPVGDIDRSTVGRLKLAWRWNTGERGVPDG